MPYEVVVVGAGVGGLTLAALLAARGVGVCVLEKESHAGGCAAPFAGFNYRFEPGAGLYAGWQPEDGIHARVFAELPVAPPPVRRIAPAYIVRLPDGAEVRVGVENQEEFEGELQRAFPECAAAAIAFYREIGPLADALRRSLRRAPALPTLSRFRRMRLLATELRTASRILALERQSAAPLLADTSLRFRRFIDAQLQLSAQRASDECAALYAAIALTEPRHGLYAIRGGAATLTNALVESINKSGGTIRFDTTALRLAYTANGQVSGVTLLSGETVAATRAVVSNLTIWDTYGKLVGLNRTPPAIRARLKTLRGWGAYLLYLGIDEDAARRLPGDQMLVLQDWQQGQRFMPESAQFMFSLPPAWDQTRAPAGQRAATVSFFTDAEQWFSFHEDEGAHESQDQLMLERCWERLHAALPELADANAELIETATPRTFYEQTRRKLGMVGGIGQSPDVFGPRAFTHRTSLPNLYAVGDTVFPGNGLAAVTYSALIAADEIAPRR